jgi:septum formation topological specificity factor MinE
MNFKSQILYKIQKELEVRNKELHVAVDNSKRLLSENKILEQNLNIEKKKKEEVNSMY